MTKEQPASDPRRHTAHGPDQDTLARDVELTHRPDYPRPPRTGREVDVAAVIAAVGAANVCWLTGGVVWAVDEGRCLVLPTDDTTGRRVEVVAGLDSAYGVRGVSGDPAGAAFVYRETKGVPLGGLGPAVFAALWRDPARIRPLDGNAAAIDVEELDLSGAYGRQTVYVGAGAVVVVNLVGRCDTCQRAVFTIEPSRFGDPRGMLAGQIAVESECGTLCFECANDVPARTGT